MRKRFKDKKNLKDCKDPAKKNITKISSFLFSYLFSRLKDLQVFDFLDNIEC